MTNASFRSAQQAPRQANGARFQGARPASESAPARQAHRSDTDTASVSQDNGKGEFFNLHVSGCGYLSRVRWVGNDQRRGGRKAEPFLACAVNALRGNIDEPQYTYFDLRVSGQEAIDVIQSLEQDVNNNRKVFVAFKVGDIYAHAYDREVKDEHGRKTGQFEAASLVKGRLLLITHVKVDGETVYQRQDDEDGAGSDGTDDTGSADDAASSQANAQQAPSPAPAPAPAPAPRGREIRADRTRVRHLGETATA